VCLCVGGIVAVRAQEVMDGSGKTDVSRGDLSVFGTTKCADGTAGPQVKQSIYSGRLLTSYFADQLGYSVRSSVTMESRFIDTSLMGWVVCRRSSHSGLHAVHEVHGDAEGVDTSQRLLQLVQLR